MKLHEHFLGVFKIEILFLEDLRRRLPNSPQLLAATLLFVSQMLRGGLRQADFLNKYLEEKKYWQFGRAIQGRASVQTERS